MGIALHRDRDICIARRHLLRTFAGAKAMGKVAFVWAETWYFVPSRRRDLWAITTFIY